jgi:hypothetical protein
LPGSNAGAGAGAGDGAGDGAGVVGADGAADAVLPVLPSAWAPTQFREDVDSEGWERQPMPVSGSSLIRISDMIRYDLIVHLWEASELIQTKHYNSVAATEVVSWCEYQLEVLRSDWVEVRRGL